MSRAFFFAFLVLWPWEAVAQDWATRAYCEVDARPVEPSDFAPHDLERLETAAAQIPNGIGKFWRIEAPTGERSYLWGTYHASQPAVLDLPDAVTSQLAAARLLAVEVDFTFPDREAFLTQHDLPGRYSDPSDPFAASETLDLSFLGKDAEEWVYNRLYGFGTTEDALYVLTYAGLAELLLADPCEDYWSGVIPVQDDYLFTLARIADVDVAGLEEPGEFLADLADDPGTAKAIVAVYASYLEPPESNTARNAAFTLYCEGRLGLLAAWDAAHVEHVYGRDGMEALRKTDAYLLDLRNERFLARIAAELSKGGVFLAVGAGHIPGKKGLVSLLEAAGYTVSRIVLPGELQ